MHTIRPAMPAALPFMAEMLYEAATVAYALRGTERPPKDDVLRQPSNARYLDGWGREGDAGVIAVDGAGAPLGAAWYRQFAPHERGDGVIAEVRTPEVAIAVAEHARSRGIGEALLRALQDAARDAGYARLVLSVDPENPARRLYGRCGFRELPAGNPHAGTSVLMAVDL